MTGMLRLLRGAAGSDRDLLERYARARDEAAFEALVRRYGPGVWAACVRLAGRDAEDAFQAVFLVLTRKAGTVTGSLPAWLHAVTRRVAANVRRTARRRTEVEAAAARSPESTPGDTGDGLALIDEELAGLPERYRAVLIVCGLDGRSRGEAAECLGWSDAQVKGRLERAREMLRSRLARRGVELGAVLLAVAAATGPVPARATQPSTTVLTLTHGVIRAMTIRKLTLAAAVLAAGVGITFTGGVVLRAQPGDPAPSQPPVAKDPPGKQAGVGVPQDKAAPAPKTPEDNFAQKLGDLQMERIAALKALVNLNEKLVQAARADFGEVLEARVLLLGAQLDAVRSDVERALVYTETIDTLKTYEAWAAKRFESGHATQATGLKVKAQRLQVEIQFEIAKEQARDRKAKRARPAGKPE